MSNAKPIPENAIKVAWTEYPSRGVSIVWARDPQSSLTTHYIRVWIGYTPKDSDALDGTAEEALKHYLRVVQAYAPS